MQDQSLKGWSEEKTKEFSIGANCQAGFDPSGSQRDVPAFRAIYRAAIYNAINYIKNGYAS